ncbi:MULTISPECIES: DUF4351 domain-containing protein [unclassified Nostoc]|uniref:DUF4351 domain-containing protein n=1 Tax=unclassified Nostoc TaxID=2593658 RepID=UPI002FF4D622
MSEVETNGGGRFINGNCLTKRFGELSLKMRSHISSLLLSVLENLSEALLDFCWRQSSHRLERRF